MPKNPAARIIIKILRTSSVNDLSGVNEAICSFTDAADWKAVGVVCSEIDVPSCDHRCCEGGRFDIKTDGCYTACLT